MNASRQAQKLVLGTAQFGLPYGISNTAGQTPLAEARAILDLAKQAGIGQIDTAIAYGDSERVLGKLGMTDWQVITKLPKVPDSCDSVSEWVQKQINGSLQRLRLSRITGLLLHSPTQLLGPFGQELYRALVDQKAEGLVDKIGISIYGPSELDALPGHMTLDIVQAPANLLDTRMRCSGWAARLKDAGCEFHARSVFLQGLLLMRPTDRPAQFQRWETLWQAWDTWLTVHGLTALQACVRYAFQESEADRLVIGIVNAKQLSEILEAIDGPLPELPIELRTGDLALLNPAAWGTR